jgi:hypothetical protein
VLQQQQQTPQVCLGWSAWSCIQTYKE